MASILPFSNALGNAPFHHKYHAQVNLSKHAPCRQQRVETKIITCINLDQKGVPHSHRQTQNGKIRRQVINVSVFFLLFFSERIYISILVKILIITIIMVIIIISKSILLASSIIFVVQNENPEGALLYTNDFKIISYIQNLQCIIKQKS